MKKHRRVNPNLRPIRTTGDDEIRAARRKALSIVFHDYPNLLGNYAGSMVFHVPKPGTLQEVITDEEKITNAQIKVMELTFALFVARIFNTRVNGEMNQKARYHFGIFYENLVKDLTDYFRNYRATVSAKINLENPEKITGAVLGYENVKGRDLMMMLAFEKQTDPRVDEFKFWQDVRASFLEIMPSMQPVLDTVWNEDALEYTFKNIESGVKYQ